MTFNLILFDKPFGVLCQFSGESPNLSDFIDDQGFYAAGRLDKDSEGLLLLTNDGKLQNRISDPKFKMEKTYWVQVEGEISEQALAQLRNGLQLKDGMTRPAQADHLSRPLPDRTPGIRIRKSQPTSWIELTIKEGRNRQVRRMTAAAGFPTLRLYRHRVGPWSLENYEPGVIIKTNVNL